MLGLGGHRHEVKRDAVGLDNFTVRFVVGDHAGDDEGEVLGLVACEQIVEAMFLLGAKHDNAPGLGGVG